MSNCKLKELLSPSLYFYIATSTFSIFNLHTKILLIDRKSEFKSFCIENLWFLVHSTYCNDCTNNVTTNSTISVSPFSFSTTSAVWTSTEKMTTTSTIESTTSMPTTGGLKTFAKRKQFSPLSYFQILFK